MPKLALLLLPLASACAIVNGSAYRVKPKQLCPLNVAAADSIRQHEGCIPRDSTPTLEAEK